MTNAQIKYIVNRFLGWKLPDNFQPDAGISFNKYYNEDTEYPMKHTPVGTNLFDAYQTEEMIKYITRGVNDIDEAIICSAIQLYDGYIVRGHRHNDCIRTIRGIPRYEKVSVENQGFMTSKNRFVDRYEGYKIHFKTDKEKQLFSEDVY